MKWVLRFLVAIFCTLILVPLGTTFKNICCYIYDLNDDNVDWKFKFTVDDKVRTSGGWVYHNYQNWFYWAFKIIK